MAASDLVREGNEAFVDDDFEVAIKKYTEALELNAYDAETYLKRAAAYMKLSNNQAAAADASSAVSLQPQNCKAHLRKGIALFHLNDFLAAKQVFLDALQLDKENKELKMWIRKCDAELDLAEKETKLGPASAQEVVFGVATEDLPATQKTTNQTANSQGAVNGEQPVSAGADSTTSSVADTSAAVSTATSESQSRQEQPQAKVGPPKPRYDWYQTETHVVITIMIKNTKQENVKVEFGEKTLSTTVKLPSGSDFSLELDLAHAIVPAQCKTKIMTTKIELKMKKAEGIRWSSLEGEDEVKAKPIPKQEKSQSDISTVHKYPSSRHVGKDWDKLAAQIAKDEKEEKLEGEAALNQLFQQIYGDGSEEVRRAMNKSFVESGGTVLSTNWDEVKRGHVDCKPPDGMEWKKWDH
ncbi:Suppressor of G2 allele of SKP1 [Porites harrisoni]